MTKMRLGFLCALCAEIAKVATVAAITANAGEPAASRRRVVLDAPGHVCEEGKGTTAHGGEPGAAFKIVDWRGRETGHSGVFDDEGVAAIPPLPTGYYNVIPLVTRHSSLVTSDGDGGETRLASIAVVPPLESRVFDHDSFYATDQGTIWELAGRKSFLCPWNGGDQQRTLADILRLGGMWHVRDRVSPGALMSASDVFNGSFFLRNAELMRERGITVCYNMASVPGWAIPRKRMPTDLAAAFTLCSCLASEFGDRVEAWEFWNEPDIGFAPCPVWDYAAGMKAGILGFRAGNPAAIAMPAGLCTSPGNWYMRTLFANDVAKFADGFNYHSYWPLASYRANFGALRKYLESEGAGERAVWLTELGTNLEGQSEDPGAMPAFKAHSPAQESVVAEFCPKALALLQMEGIARAYWFIVGAYSEREGKKDWGALRRDGTVKPIFSALSTIMRELGDTKIVGELSVGEGARAFLFERADGTQSICLWAVSPVDRLQGEQVWGANATNDPPVAVRIAATDGVYRLCDLCGIASSVAATNGVLALSASRFPQYVSGVRGLAADISARPAGKLGAPPAGDDEDLSVIVRVDLDETDWRITRNKSRAVLKGEAGKLRVTVWNLGNEAKTGLVEVVGARLAGLPATPFALGPRGTAPAFFDCLFAPDGESFDTDLVLSGLFKGRRGSRTCVPILLERRFFGESEEIPLAWRDLKSWRGNDSAHPSSISWDADEGAVRFDWEWHGDAGRWAYPFYRLAEGESLAGARALVFEVKSAQDKMENDFNRAYVMLDSQEIAYEPPNGNWERRYVELPPEGLESFREFRIGANPRGRKVTFWLRNVSVLRSNGSQ